MCIAIYKPMGQNFPNKKTLKVCFENNPDGAGFMVARGDKVEIHKGFMGFTSFWKALRKVRGEYGDDKAYVMHFRISTQGGVRKDGCHPFPLSGDMDDLRALDAESDIGIAHNGIISLTSEYGKADYSDTMKFITDYLSLIIKDSSYCKDDDTLKLIERLCGSRLAILDKRGHCELIGRGWGEDKGVWYSNDSYLPRSVKATTYYPSLYEWGTEEPAWWSNYDDAEYIYNTYYAKYDDFINAEGMFEFPDGECPDVELGDASYCELCTKYCKCYGFDVIEEKK